MNIKGTRSEKALHAALQGEAMAMTKYLLYAETAEKEGYHQIGKLFRDIAENEKAHAEMWHLFLHNMKQSDTLSNLKDCAGGENYENTNMYPQMAQVANSEELPSLAEAFLGVAKIEGHHREMLYHYIETIESDTLYKKEETTPWLCENCGHIHFSKNAPEKCPVCHHPQGYFVEYTERY